MSNNPFVILGISQDATQSEILEAYKTKRAYYQEHVFDEGEAGAEAAKNIGLLDAAYQQAMEYASQAKTVEGTGDSLYEEVKTHIKNHEPDKAQTVLDNMSMRNAEWHYYQSIIFFEKNWLADSKKQLEICVEMEPSNSKYATALANVKKKIDGSKPFTEQDPRKFETPNQQANRSYQQQDQMRTADDACCTACQTLWCMDCCCECMGGDLIRCC